MPEPRAFRWTCRCGALAIDVAGGPSTRLVCYCRDCRAFARHLGATGLLDAAGGTDLVQLTPDRLTVVAGGDRLACLRLTRHGPLRWYAACCDTPLANTPTTRQVPFAALTVAQTAPAGACGESAGAVNVAGATGPVRQKPASLARAVYAAIGRALPARLAGRHLATPFFDAAGAPVSPPRTPDPEALRAAYRDPA